jgi:hypothetical protein
MSRSTSFRYAVSANLRNPCSVPACSRPRKGLSGCCSMHTWRSQRWGHPQGRPVSNKHYAVELLEVKALLSKHAAHEGVSSALQWLGQWMDDAGNGMQVPGQAHMRRLWQYEVTPERILAEAAALNLYSYRCPNRLVDDERLTFAIAHNVLSLAPKDYRTALVKGRPRTVYKPIAATVKRDVGRHIRNVLGLLLLNITNELQRIAAARQALTLRLAKSFAVPSISIT